MSRALRIIFVTELVLGGIWTLYASMASGAGGLAVIYLFLIVYPVFAIFFLVAAWAYWKHPDERRRAAWIMALPVIFWFLPGIIRKLAGGVLSEQEFLYFLGALVAAFFATCFIAPRKAVALVPDFLLRSRLFNALIFIAVLLGWLVLAGIILYVGSGKGGGYQGDTGYGLGLAIVIAAFYLVGLGVGSFVASAWAWLGLRGGVEDTPRKWHIAQIVIALPGVAIGVIVLSWLVGQGQVG